MRTGVRTWMAYAATTSATDPTIRRQQLAQHRISALLGVLQQAPFTAPWWLKDLSTGEIPTILTAGVHGAQCSTWNTHPTTNPPQRQRRRVPNHEDDPTKEYAYGHASHHCPLSLQGTSERGSTWNIQAAATLGSMANHNELDLRVLVYCHTGRAHAPGWTNKTDRPPPRAANRPATQSQHVRGVLSTGEERSQKRLNLNDLKEVNNHRLILIE